MTRFLPVFAVLALSVSVPAQADDAARLLLREPDELVATCHQSPTELRGEARRDGWTIGATDAGVRVEPPGGAPRLLTTCDGLPSNRVTGVSAAPDGAWLVSTLGGGVVRLRLGADGALAGVTPLDGLPVLQTTAVAARGDEVWVGTAEEGLWRWRDGVADQPVRKLRDGLVSALATPDGGPPYVGRGRFGLSAVSLPGGRVRRVLKERYVRSLTVDGGRLIVDAPSAVCTLAVGGRRVTCGAPRPDEALPSDGPAPHATALAVHQGRLWVGTFAHGLWTTDGRAWRREDLSAAPGVLGYVNDLEERDGVLWLASPNGAARHDRRGWRVLGVADGLPEGHVNAVLPLADATWLATSRGLARLDGGRFTVWTHEAGALSDNGVNAVAVWEDEIWAGTYDAGVDHLGPGGWSPASTERPLWVNPGGLFPLDGVLALAAPGDGLWARGVDGGWFAWTPPASSRTPT